MIRAIDLNADLGERFEGWNAATEEAILRSVTTVHIACGFHSGGASIMAETVRSAIRWNVEIGAHPSYPDRDGFGRRPMELGWDEIRALVFEQLAALEDVACAAGTRVRSVKPHGALYNRMAVDQECASAIVTAIQDFGEDVWLVAPAGSRAAQVASLAGLRVAEEAFCDRGYNRDGTLVSREQVGAVVSDPTDAAHRAVRLAQEHRVDTIDGEALTLTPSTLCIHGDTPDADVVATEVRLALERAGIMLRPLSSQ